ncbi:MAG TPA: hypothetical protein VI136_17525 [Verrucomicrobiae bacterium]
MRELNHAAAERLAKRLLANAAAWARTILVCVGRRDPGIEGRLASEALAYSLCLLDERLKRASEADGFVSLVRSCCARIMDERAWWRANRHRRLAQAPLAADGSDFTQKMLAHAEGTEPRFGLSEEAFDEFCQATGLSSPVLFGRDENLAALVFYIVAHNCVSAGGRLSRRQTNELLRATRECRLHTERLVFNPMAESSASTLAPACGLPHADAQARHQWKLNHPGHRGSPRATIA